jgi:DNA mismatch repair protein MLH1
MISQNSKFSKLNILSEDSINLIDSNKTITKLSIVIKELIENSIDAQSKNITIFIKEGGLSLMEVKDDGVGISKENFTKLCKRFNSSKLEKYEDINNLNTFGFRGEALSILSYISHLTIVSRTENSQVGYEAVFKNGKISENENINLKAIPCEKGTIIKVENIFYNNLIRKKYYDKSEETKDIINLLSKYAFHFHKINFNLSSNVYSNKILTTFNINKNNLDELTIKKSLSARLFNQEIQDNLFYFNNKASETSRDINNINLKNEIDFECYFTKPSANLDKSLLLVFLNNRLINNNSVKKLFDSTYAKLLIKNGNYFAYIHITCPPDKIDVNVRANKSEVFFMDEEKFFIQLKTLLEESLNEELNSKNYYIGEYSNFPEHKKKDKEVLFTNDSDIKYAKDKVRVDLKSATLDKYLKGLSTRKSETACDQEPRKTYKNTDILHSIYDNLFNEDRRNSYLTEILKNSFYVGYENQNNLLFIQYQTSLYIINCKFLLKEYFLYLITKGSHQNFINLKIKSSYSVENIFKFIKENCLHDKYGDGIIESKFKEVEQNSIYIEDLIREKIELLKLLGIKINNSLQVEETFLINLFPQGDISNIKNMKKNFLCYIPLIYYSIIEYVSFQSKQIKNSQIINENLNFLLETSKIYAFYLSNYYSEFIRKLPIEQANFLLKECVIALIKSDKDFFLRKNIKEDEILEKIIDTETLYTVFERC